MRSSVETLEDNRVRLTVELDEAEFEPEVEAAFKRIAREVRIPGFRPGRVPRQLLEARLGHQAGRHEALRTALADYYARAVVKHDVDAIDLPDIEITEGAESGPVCFDAVVEVRPTVAVSGYDSLRVEIPSPLVEPGEIDAEIDGLRQQFAELSPVGRNAHDDDHLRIDISCTLGGETVDGLTASDYDYRLGTGAVVPEIDDNLRGASAGDILEFHAAHPDADEERRLSFRVLVKEVLETVLPDLDDDFVAANTEFDSVEGLRSAVEAGRSRTAVLRAASARHEAIVEAVAALVTDDVPQGMVDGEADSLLNSLVGDLSRRGYELEDYLDSVGQSREELEAGMRGSALRSVKLDLALRAVAAAEGLDADDDAVEAELRRAVLASRADAAGAGAAGAERAGEAQESEDEAVAEDEAAAEASRLRRELASTGRLSAMRSEMSKRAAMEWIVERVELIDPSGQAVDPGMLKLPEPDDRPVEEAEEAPDPDWDSDPYPDNRAESGEQDAERAI